MYFLLAPDFVEKKNPDTSIRPWPRYIPFEGGASSAWATSVQKLSTVSWASKFPVQGGMIYPDPKNYASTQLPEGVGKMSFSDEILVSG